MPDTYLRMDMCPKSICNIKSYLNSCNSSIIYNIDTKELKTSIIKDCTELIGQFCRTKFVGNITPPKYENLKLYKKYKDSEDFRAHVKYTLSLPYIDKEIYCINGNPSKQMYISIEIANGIIENNFNDLYWVVSIVINNSVQYKESFYA